MKSTKLKLPTAHGALNVKLFLSVFTVVGAVMLVFVSQVAGSLFEQAVRDAERNLSQKTELMVNLLTEYDRDLRQRALEADKAFAQRMEGALERSVVPSAARSSRSGPLPPPIDTVVMRLNGRVLNKTHELVDQFTQATGAVATVFARTDGDDFVRVTTSLLDKDGRRAVGTLLLRTHPAYEGLLKGQPYTGLATLFDRKYMTHYEPLFDAKGGVIGVRFIGLDFTGLVSNMFAAIRSSKPSDSGNFFVIDATKDDASFGRLLVHPTHEGTWTQDAKALNGSLFVQQMLESKTGVLRIDSSHPAWGGESAPERIYAYRRMEGWRWLVVGTADLVEVTAQARVTRNLLLAAGVVALVVLSALLYALGGYFGRRLHNAMAKSNEELLAMNESLRGHERRLQARENLLFSMVNACPDPLVMTSADGRVWMASQSALDFYACNEEQLIGRPIVDMYPEYMKELRREIHQKISALERNGKQMVKYELVALTHDKREVPIEVHYTVVDSPEGPLTVAGFRDLTERKRVEAELLKGKIAAEASTRMKSEFLALMSHELRTPMAGVMGMLSLALRSDMSKTVRDKIILAHKNTSSLLAIVNDLLDLAKIEAGKLTLERIDFTLQTMLDDAMLLLHERALEKSVHFALRVDSRLPLYFLGDPTRVRQVLFNLVGNAIKFTEQGHVNVSVALAGPEPKTAQFSVGDVVRVRFVVEDTGIGMSEEARSRMFQKFEQADMSTTRKFGGTGLGLSICKQIVELMGGQIGVESTLGKGSTFYFELDLPVGTRPPEEQAYVLGRHDYQLKILVAEDAHTNQLIISTLLDEMGHQATVVENGELALDALTREHFDLILMDGRMPVMDGLEATRHIRAGHWGGRVFSDRQIPIIALTANASEQDRVNFLAAGMNEFLTKPIDEVQLHKTLNRIIEHRLAHGLPLRQQVNHEEVKDSELALAQLDALAGLGALPEEFGKAVPHEPEVAKVSRAEELRERMMAVFKEQVPQRLQEIEAAVAADDWNTAAIVVHGIKGSVAYIWPDSEVYHLAAEMENMADSGQTLAFVDRFGMLQSLLAELQNA
jgi:PAS domain S-box-containing protein